MYRDACNVQFLLCGVRGLSVLFASGDQGVWGRSGHVDNVFHPDFPAGTKYIGVLGGWLRAWDRVVVVEVRLL